MCGIAGLVDPTGISEADGAAMAPMVASLHHRGPDDSGTYFDGRAALGHARLSILDTSAAGHQPMCNEDGSIWIVFNGEIYNFPELHESLAARGHKFRSRCDTEAIVHLYEDHGERCVEHLRGMFAFAIWDGGRRRLLLARDRIGIKPLYYHHRGTRLAFGSEIKAILRAPGTPREVDREALHDFLTFHWVPAPKSMFRGIAKLPPGHTAVLDEHGLRLREYWDLRFPEPLADGEEALRERFLADLEESVRVHMLADVPLGAFLSGGIDSSSVVATMAGLSPGPVVTNSIGFEEAGYNEMRYADLVARRFRTDHHREVVRPDAADLVERLSWHFDEPFADSSAIPTYCVSRMARRNVTVALSGDGGDENMAGYRKYRFHQRERAIRRLVPGPLRRALFGTLGRIYPKADWLPRPLRARSTLQNLGLSEVEAIYRSRAPHDPDAMAALIRPEARAPGYDPLSVVEHHYGRCPRADPLNRELYVDLKTYLVDDVLTKVDRASMAVGLEVRVPILDHRFVEFLAAVPPDLKLRRGQGKYLFKQAVRPLLGDEIVDRPKMGFSVPLGDWLRGPLRSLAQDSLFGVDAYVSSLLDAGRLRRLWEAHQGGLRDNHSAIWAVLMLELWGRQFLGSPPGPPRGRSSTPAAARPQGPDRAGVTGPQP